MHRPPQRRDSLRQRVSEGRVRRQVRERRVFATLRITRRTIAVVAGLAMLGGVATVTQVASAENDPAAQFLGVGSDCAVATSDLELHVEEEADGTRHYHYRGKHKHKYKHKKRGGSQAEPTAEPTDPGTEDPGTEDPGTADPGTEDPGACDDGDEGASGGDAPGQDPSEGSGEDPGNPGEGSGSDDGDTPGDDEGSDTPGDDDSGTGEDTPGEDETPSGPTVLGTDCSLSQLPIHEGFQDAPRCVETAMGEVSAAENNPTLLITAAPTEVSAGEAFTIQVSTRNLVRDRFLGAAAGGYYRESSYLTEDGLTRGHFHLGCRILPDPNLAEVPNGDPAFFVAVEDEQGGAEPDFVNVEIPGLDEPGLYRCMAWAGDGSHRVPAMQFARHFVAVDVVRIIVS